MFSGLARLQCRAGGAAGEASMFAKTVGLDNSFDIFSWEESRPWRGLRCRAGGAAGWRTRSAKNMFIRHVIRHVEAIKRV